MSPIRRWLVVLVLALGVLSSAPVVRAEDPLAPERPKTLEELTARLEALARRLGELIELAEKDPRWRDVATYEAYREKDFKNQRREVKAKTLVEIMVDEMLGEKGFELRNKAYELLKGQRARSLDPDLLVEKGQRSPRKDFCKRHVVEHIRADEALARQFTHNLLLAYFPRARNDPTLNVFDAKNANRAERRKAHGAWQKFLRK